MIDSNAQDLPRPIAIKRALAIFSDSWSFSVLQELFFGVRRFDDFQRNLSISRSVLTRRLRHLEEQKIIIRKQYNTRPNRYEYRLSERGRAMYPIFVTLRQWGETWLEDARTPELSLVHKPCGKALEPQITCKECATELVASDIEYSLNT